MNLNLMNPSNQVIILPYVEFTVSNNESHISYNWVLTQSLYLFQPQKLLPKRALKKMKVNIQIKNNTKNGKKIERKKENWWLFHY